jgi:hypothetical protein
MIETVRLTDIPFELDVPGLLKKLRLEGRPEYAERCTRLARQAVPIARPKAVYGIAGVESKGEDTVVVDGIVLTSRILRVNLDKAHRVFPFVVTCGTELATWSQPISDMLERFWADAIMEEALGSALDALKSHLSNRYQPGHTAMMNPGSLADWPIEQQTPLFGLLGATTGQIGVKLTDTFIMVPVKSASGLLFETEATYENCQLCPREACPNRRAPYDPGLYDREYSTSCR